LRSAAAILIHAEDKESSSETSVLVYILHGVIFKSILWKTKTSPKIWHDQARNLLQWWLREDVRGLEL